MPPPSTSHLERAAHDGEGPVAARGEAAIPPYREALEHICRLAPTDPSDAVRDILRIQAEVMHVARVSLWHLRTDKSALDCEAFVLNCEPASSAGMTLHAQDYPRYFAALRECRSIVVHDAYDDERTAEFAEGYFKPAGVTSMLDVPVWHSGTLYGVICLEHVGPTRRWTTEEHDFALGVAERIALALEVNQRRLAEERFRLLSRVTDDIFWEVDIRTLKIVWGDGAAAALRVRSNELGDGCEWWLSRIHPEEVERVRASFAEACAGKVGYWVEEYRMQLGDGSWGMFVDRAYLGRDGAGLAARLVGAMADVTRQRQLERKVAISERMAALGTLAAGVAHEINNPLAFIKANLEFLKDELGSLPPEATEALNDALDGARRVRSIVADMGAFSRGNSQPTQVDLTNVLAAALRMATNEIKHVATLVEEYRPAPRVLADESRLGQVALNLVTNAAHAMKSERKREHTLWVRVRASPNGHAVFEVEDTGPGIPPHLRQRVFDPFFTTKKIGEGTGLGMSICHGIVSGLGGEIEIHDGAAGGCLIRVTLPPASTEAAVGAASSEAAGSKRTPVRVLIVDDEPQVARAVARTLKSTHIPTIATSAAEAHERIRGGEHFDAIICDVLMPHMTGPELQRVLAAERRPEAGRFIFLSGGAHGVDLPADVPALRKPYEAGMLFAAIDGLVT